MSRSLEQAGSAAKWRRLLVKWAPPSSWWNWRISRCKGCSGPRWGASTGTCTLATGWKCISGWRQRLWSAPARSRVSDWPTGALLPADVVVVGVGVAPMTELAEKAGIEVGNGVLTDEFLQTSVPGIFAAGDLANAFHPLFGERVRVEHWANARNQGPAAARNMLGKSRPYVRVPYFYSDQYDVSMEYSGYAPTWDEVIFRGDVASQVFMAFWLKDGRVAAGMNVNIGDAAGKISDLVSSRRVVDKAKLADPDVSLADV